MPYQSTGRVEGRRWEKGEEEEGGDNVGGGARKVIVSCCSLGARISAAGSIAQLTSAGTHARRPADLVSAAPGREPALRPSATEAGEDSVSSSPLAQYGMFDRVELGGGRSGTC